MRRRLSVAAPFPSLILQRHRMCAIRVWARPVDPAASAANVRAGSGCDQRCVRPIFNDPARARWVRFAKSSFLRFLQEELFQDTLGFVVFPQARSDRLSVR